MRNPACDLHLLECIGHDLHKSRRHYCLDFDCNDLVVMTQTELWAQNSAIDWATTQSTSALSAASAAAATHSTLEVKPYQAMADDYTAISTIFGGVLVAATLIWGARKMLELFNHRPEA